MARKKKPDEPTLKDRIIADLTERGVLQDVDLHLVDRYCAIHAQIVALEKDIEKRGVMYTDEREVERANPSLRALSALLSQLNAFSKALGIGPYGRKLTTGQQTKPKKEPTKVSQLRPRSRNKAN